MRESATYSAILDEGRAEEARTLLLRLGELRFGSPDEGAHATIAAISKLDELEALLERLLNAESWKELLAE